MKPPPITLASNEAGNDFDTRGRLLHADLLLLSGYEYEGPSDHLHSPLSWQAPFSCVMVPVLEKLGARPVFMIRTGTGAALTNGSRDR